MAQSVRNRIATQIAKMPLMGGAIEISEHIQTLWNDMADFDVASSDDALEHLLRFLHTEFDAENVSWLAAIRVQDDETDYAAQAWRQRAFGYLFPAPELSARVDQEAQHPDSDQADITTLRNIALAGTWRANRLIDLAGADWFDSDFYRRHYLDHGHADAIWAGCPVNADAELYFGLFRSPDQPRFTAQERDRVGAVLRSLKWFYRHVFISRGLCIANAPLTTMERKVLHGLLAGYTEKEIAREQGQSRHTTHDHVKTLYRKFGITNRAALMAIWLRRAQ